MYTEGAARRKTEIKRLRIKSEYFICLFQTQGTSAKTTSGRCRRGHMEKKVHMIGRIIVINVKIYNITNHYKKKSSHYNMLKETSSKKIYIGNTTIEQKQQKSKGRIMKLMSNYVKMYLPIGKCIIIIIIILKIKFV